MGQDAVSPTHPKPGGPMVEFYLGKSVRGVGSASHGDRDQFLPVGINGYNTLLKMGARNTVPKDVYDQLMNCRSRTVNVDLEKAERNPRPATQYRQPTQLKTETLMDYEVELIKEGK